MENYDIIPLDIYLDHIWEMYAYSPVPTMMVSDSGEIVHYNTAMNNITGYTYEEMTDEKTFLMKLFPEKYFRREFMTIITSDETRNIVTGISEFEIIQRNGEKRFVNIVPTDVILDGVTTGYRIIQGFDITGLKNTEKQLIKAKDCAELLFDVSPSAIYTVDTKRRITSWNKKAEEITGYSADEIIGKTCDVFAKEPCCNNCALFKNEKTNQKKNVECLYQRKDGRQIIISKNADLLRDGNGTIIGGIESFDDITELKQVQEEQKKLVALIENSKEFIGVASMDGNVLYVNRAGLGQLGVDSLEEVKTTKILDYIPDEEKDFFNETMIPALMTDGQWEGERKIQKHKTGSVADVYMNVFLIKSDIDGGPLSIAAVMKDITEIKRMHRHFLQSQKMESIGRLAGGIAHDFNNILTAITGFSDIVLMSVDKGSEIEEMVNEIKLSAERAAKLTRQLLAFSRKQIIEPTVLNLNDVIENMFQMLERLIGENIVFTFERNDNLWPVRMDITQMEQVLTNLTVNARDAMPDGGTLDIGIDNFIIDKKQTKELQNLSHGEYVRLTIEDTGFGIDQVTLENAFEPFYTTKDISSGTGLGLATCYGIIKQNNGHIWIESEPGKGTTVNIVLPRFTEDPDKLCDRTENISMPDGTETILVVEDEHRVRSLISKLLRSHGYTVLEAHHGVEAIDIVYTFGAGCIDLAITDFVMPRMSGMELVEKIRELCSDMKIILLSGYTGDILAQEKNIYTDIELFEKPFTASSLLTKVRHILDG